MNKLSQKIYDWISYEKKYQRELNAFNEKVKKHIDMDEVEFKMAYVNGNAKYVYEKLVFAVVFTIIILILVSVNWFAYKFTANISSMKDIPLTSDNILAIILVMGTITLSIVGIIIVVLHKLIKDIYLSKKEKILLDEMKEMRIENQVRNSMEV